MPRPLDEQRRAFEEARRRAAQDIAARLSARQEREIADSRARRQASNNVSPTRVVVLDYAEMEPRIMASRESHEHAMTVAQIEMEEQQRRQSEYVVGSRDPINHPYTNDLVPRQSVERALSDQMRYLDQRHQELCRRLDEEHRRAAGSATDAIYYLERCRALDREYDEARQRIHEDALRLPPQADEFPRPHWARHEGRPVRTAENRTAELAHMYGASEGRINEIEDDIQPVVVAVAEDPAYATFPVAVICANRMMFDRYEEERRIEREAGLEFPRAVFIYSEENIRGYLFSQVETYGSIYGRQARLIDLCKTYCR